ncbi:MAG: metal ABC transporter ATP-binding protein, partial [Spirochaetaceae bacterium]
AVELSHLYFQYPGVPVFQGVSLAIPQGGLTQIVGPNGGGKTTLARLLLGLLKPYAGTVRVFGQVPAATQQRSGYVPQHSLYDPQFPAVVSEVVMTGRLTKRFGLYSREDRAAVERVFDELDISDIRKRRFAELSGGQRQRVLLARALVSNPALLILDEPTANIDRGSARRLEGLVATLKQRVDVLLITHDFDFLSDQVDRVMCVNRAVHVHPRSELTTDDMHRLFSGHLHDLGVKADYSGHSETRP